MDQDAWHYTLARRSLVDLLALLIELIALQP
jgi:hypothetical protein